MEVVLAVGGGSVLDAGKAIAGLLRTSHQRPRPPRRLRGSAPLPRSERALRGRAHHRRHGQRGDAQRGHQRARSRAASSAPSATSDWSRPTPSWTPTCWPVRRRPSSPPTAWTRWPSCSSPSSRVRASPLTDSLALAGLAAARDGLLAWHEAPDGPAAPAARARMAYAALLSGICLSHAGLGAPHGLAAALGALLPIPHGAACGAVLPHAVAVTIAALEAREPASAALARFATLGRLLGPPASPDRPSHRQGRPSSPGGDAPRLGRCAGDPGLGRLRPARRRHPDRRGRQPRQLDAHQPHRARRRRAGRRPRRSL